MWPLDAGIAHAGAGRDLDGALDPARFTAGGLAVGAVAFTDNTPEYAAGEDSPGVARVEMDPGNDRTRDLVGEALSRAETTDPDLLVASLHWGPNIEVQEGVPILYDAGDFVDDYAVDRDLRNDRSVLFEVRADADGRVGELRLLPTEMFERDGSELVVEV